MVSDEFDVKRHILYFKHEILNNEEANELLERYKITKKKLPSIKKSDPGLSGLNAKVGDIVRIRRKSPTAGESFYYRVVVNG
ncbi:MAG: DNA-directed polymerase subunit [Candidatus Woesearchaeota archaeon]|nr:DNA-directed polymerase subunit [Candidatus Woesearchaeota archaeon]MDK2908222.1 DNA-directed polymerase subunit [Candidatus Woesearchaeota archaeon]